MMQPLPRRNGTSREVGPWPAGPAVASPTPPPAVTLLVAGIFVLLLFFSLHAARPVLVPVVLGLLLALVLAPLRRALEGLGLPRGAASALVMLGLLLVLAGGAVALAQPAAEWLERAPQYVARLKATLNAFMLGLEEVREATEEVAEAAEAGDGDALTVELEEETLGEALLSGTGQAAAGAVVVLVLAFFLLATGGGLRRNGARLFARFGDRRRALRISKRIERDVSAYLLTITAINAGLALAVAGVVWLAGLPSPLLWGVAAGLLNYIPYLGPLISEALLLLVGLATFEEPARALVAPGLVLCLNILEGQVITPSLLARRLTLSPVVVFLSLVLWGWLWGPAGVLLAVPLLAAFKIACDHIPSLAPPGQLLGQRNALNATASPPPRPHRAPPRPRRP